jgi:hypothetical protein
MTTSELVKKMGLEKGMSGKDGKLKGQILKYLKDGKDKLVLLEDRFKDGKNYKKLKDMADRSGKKLAQAKRSFDEYEKKAERYIEKNPKKAVAMAAAAGLLAGTLWSSFHGKKPAAPKKRK